jgi:hypothetical protein
MHRHNTGQNITMVKLAILLLALTITISKFGARFMPAEFKKAMDILSWLLGAYVVVMLILGIVAYLKA